MAARVGLLLLCFDAFDAYGLLNAATMRPAMRSGLSAAPMQGVPF